LRSDPIIGAARFSRKFSGKKPSRVGQEADVRRRGLRFEVDEPTARQRRNSRWLAENPRTTSIIAAFVFAAVGIVYALSADISWLSPFLGAIIGLAVGALLGWGSSVSYRDPAPRGRTRVLYVGALVVVSGVFMAMKLA
jgi:hypothetical protein